MSSEAGGLTSGVGTTEQHPCMCEATTAGIDSTMCRKHSTTRDEEIERAETLVSMAAARLTGLWDPESIAGLYRVAALLRYGSRPDAQAADGAASELAGRLRDAWKSEGEYADDDLDILRALCGEAAQAVDDLARMDAQAEAQPDDGFVCFGFVSAAGRTRMEERGYAEVYAMHENLDDPRAIYIEGSSEALGAAPAAQPDALDQIVARRARAAPVAHAIWDALRRHGWLYREAEEEGADRVRAIIEGELTEPCAAAEDAEQPTWAPPNSLFRKAMSDAERSERRKGDRRQRCEGCEGRRRRSLPVAIQRRGAIWSRRSGSDRRASVAVGSSEPQYQALLALNFIAAHVPMDALTEEIQRRMGGAFNEVRYALGAPAAEDAGRLERSLASDLWKAALARLERIPSEPYPASYVIDNAAQIRSDLATLRRALGALTKGEDQ